MAFHALRAKGIKMQPLGWNGSVVGGWDDTWTIHGWYPWLSMCHLEGDHTKSQYITWFISDMTLYIRFKYINIGDFSKYIPGWWFQALWKVWTSVPLFPIYGKIKSVRNISKPPSRFRRSGVQVAAVEAEAGACKSQQFQSWCMAL